MASKKLDESMDADFGSARVTMTSTPVDLTFDPVLLGKAPAEAIAVEIRRDTVQAGWNTTGRLANGIHAEQVGSGFEIVPPSDRLQDSALLQRFHKEIPAMTEDVTTRPKVLEALMSALRLMVGGGR